jgi:hypothetical protein
MAAAPGAVGNRSGYWPDLENNNLPTGWKNLIPGRGAAATLGLSGSLHGINEMIESLEKAKKDKCCP